MLDHALASDIRHAAVAPAHLAYGSVLEQIGDAHLVLLGEATHGSHEFYHARCEITKRLLRDKGFDALAVEADWPDALQVSRYVLVAEDNGSRDAAVEALAGFQRFPLWMWRNAEIVTLIRWLQSFNRSLPDAGDKVGFFGLDVYSLHRSMQAVIDYLQTSDPPAARLARTRYACFDHMAQDPQRYGHAASYGLRKDCEQEVMRQFSALHDAHLHADAANADEAFYATQHARVAKNAEAYYRTLFQGRHASWNVRDTHMTDTLDALLAHLTRRRGRQAKVVVWAHNSHIGDARATEMGEHGQINLGQLVRERHGRQQVFLLGFSTHRGTVLAASDWDMPGEIKTVQPSLPDSVERLLHTSGLDSLFLPLVTQQGRPVLDGLAQPRLERAIGVVYRPESERHSHYFHTELSRQFDAIMHFDTTRAVSPLDQISQTAKPDLPETFPSGM